MRDERGERSVYICWFDGIDGEVIPVSVRSVALLIDLCIACA